MNATPLVSALSAATGVMAATAATGQPLLDLRLDAINLHAGVGR